MSTDADVLVIGAGPAGASAAIRLATAGRRVVLIEQHRYPRRKVCGECIGAGALMVLDELGIGHEFRQLAGPELRHVGWMNGGRTVIADMPLCNDGTYRYGRALGRDRLDALLLQRARSVGVEVLQPARVHKVSGSPGRFECEYESLSDPATDLGQKRQRRKLSTPVVVDAHGSWERRPSFSTTAPDKVKRSAQSSSDLLAFKASFRNARLPIGFLPVLTLNGGYGGMVVADSGRTTIACCIRRDALEKCRASAPGESAGAAIENLLHRSCRGISEALDDAQRDGPWLSVGPVRPGIGIDSVAGVFRVGNSAGETHPLIGEGIGMALQSAALLVDCLTQRPVRSAERSVEVQQSYAAAWRRQFEPRLRIAAAYAQFAMNPALAASAGLVLRGLPPLLTLLARLAGKARRATIRRTLTQESG